MVGRADAYARAGALNLVALAAVLTDWDGVGLGPREVDLVQEGDPGGKFVLPEPQRLAFARRFGFDLAEQRPHTWHAVR